MKLFISFSLSNLNALSFLCLSPLSLHSEQLKVLPRYRSAAAIAKGLMPLSFRQQLLRQSKQHQDLRLIM